MIESINNFISDQNLEEILRKANAVYLKNITNLTDAVKMMHLYKYDNVFFDFNKTLNLPESNEDGQFYLDDDTGLYVYNYDGLFPTYADIITDIKSNVPVKLKYGANISDIDANFKLYNLLSPFCSKSFNFYFAKKTENREFSFSMRCYILNEPAKQIFYDLGTIKTITHTYSGGCMAPN